MTIKLVCTEPTCGKRLQVDDKYAGRKVSCPKCKTVIVAPGERVRSGSRGGLPAVPPAPPPPPPLPPPPPKTDRNPFGFESRSGGDRPPPKRSGMVELPAGSKDGNRKASADRDEDGPKPRPYYGRGPGEPRRARAKAWVGFAAGCGLSRWGVWAEFVGFAVGLLALGYVAYVADRGDPFGTEGGQLMLVLAPVFLGAAVGTALVWLGRARMMTIPSGTGAKGALIGAFLITLLRLFAALASVILLFLAYAEDGGRRSAEGYLAIGTVVWLVGLMLTSVADQAVLPAVAIVGGAIPSYPLRRKVGSSAVLLQVIGVVFLLLLVARALYADTPHGMDGRPVGTFGSIPPEVLEVATALLLLGLLFVYALLYSGVYAAAGRAVRAAKEAEEDEGF